MAFSIKPWLDRFGSGGSYDQPTDTGDVPDTPADAAGMRDLETRLSGYTDSREAAEVSARNTAIAAHTGDASAAHAASAISFGPGGTIAATDVQAAISEVATDAASALSSGLVSKADLSGGHVPLAQLGSGTPASGKYVDGASGAWLSLPAQSGSTPRVVGSIGSAITTQTITFSGAEEVWLVGTAAVATITLASRTAGARLLILAVLDSVTRTITVSDGSGNTQAFTLPATASGATLGIIEARCPDSTNIAAADGIGSTSGAETDPNAILKSLIDAAGDLIVGTADNTAGRIAKGSDGTVLTVSSGAVAWGTPDIAKSLGTTKGDLVVWTASGTVARQAVGTDGYALVADSSQANGVKYSHRPQVAMASKTGALTAAAGTVRLPIMEAGTIEDVRIMVGTAPTGATLIVDVNKNGTTIFTTQGNRPTVAISSNASPAAVPDVTSLAAGDYLTVDIDQIGSTVAGSDLCVAVRYRLAA